MDSGSFPVHCRKSSLLLKLLVSLGAAVLLTALLRSAAAGAEMVLPPRSEPVACPPETYQKYLKERNRSAYRVTAVAPRKHVRWAAKAQPGTRTLLDEGGGGGGGGGTLPEVLVFVNDTLYPQIETRLNTYIDDIEYEGYDVVTYRIAGGTVEDLKATIQSEYEGGRLVGCVLIGALPFALYEVEHEWALNTYAAFPIEMYLMDLDAEFLDTNPFPTAQTGIYDGYVNGENPGPEIFVGRIDASNLDPYGFSYEVSRTNAYLDKAHAWHTGTMPRARRLLAYATYMGALPGYPDSEQILDGNASDYLDRIRRDPATRSDAYEMIFVQGHGCPWGANIGEGGWLSAYTIRDCGVKSQFYDLSHCQISWFNFTMTEFGQTYHGCVGNYYIFSGSGTSLTTLGSTKVIFAEQLMAHICPYLAQHRTIGEGLKNTYVSAAPYYGDITNLFSYALLGVNVRPHVHPPWSGHVHHLECW